MASTVVMVAVMEATEVNEYIICFNIISFLVFSGHFIASKTPSTNITSLDQSMSISLKITSSLDTCEFLYFIVSPEFIDRAT